MFPNSSHIANCHSFISFPIECGIINPEKLPYRYREINFGSSYVYIFFQELFYISSDFRHNRFDVNWKWGQWWRYRDVYHFCTISKPRLTTRFFIPQEIEYSFWQPSGKKNVFSIIQCIEKSILKKFFDCPENILIKMFKEKPILKWKTCVLIRFRKHFHFFWGSRTWASEMWQVFTFMALL